MIAVRVCMKVTNEPLKRTPVVLQVDADGSETAPVLTDRAGVARFELSPTSGKILVSGVERYHGRLDGEILVDLWSITEPGNESVGMPGEFPAGSNAYPGMTTRGVQVYLLPVPTRLKEAAFLPSPAEFHLSISIYQDKQPLSFQ